MTIPRPARPLSRRLFLGPTARPPDRRGALWPLLGRRGLLAFQGLLPDVVAIQ